MLLNRSAVRQYILEMWREKRPGYPLMTRVSTEALRRYDAILRTKILADVGGHPSVGRTFNP